MTPRTRAKSSFPIALLLLAAMSTPPTAAFAASIARGGAGVQAPPDPASAGTVVVIPADWNRTYPFAERFAAGPASANGGSHRINLAAIQFLTDQLVTGSVTNARSFLPPDLRSFAQQLVRSAFATGGTDLFVVQATSPSDQTTLRKWMQTSGIGILDYIPDTAYLVRLSQAQLLAVQQRTDVFWVGLFQPAFMLEPKLEYIILQDPAHQLKLRANFALAEYPDVSTLNAALHLTPLAVLDITRTDRSWSVRLEGRALDAYVVALVPGCLWVERFAEFQLDNNVARTSTSVATGRGASSGPIMDVENVWAKGIRGEGQIASAADTGLSTGNLATLHQDFGNQSDASNPMRVLKGYALGRATTWDDNQTTGGGHGTHTSGSIVGNGFRSGSTPSTNTFPTTCFAGNAPKAQFVFQSVMSSNGSLGGIPADLTTLFQPPYNDGARVHSNSWGAAVAGAYNLDSQNVDKFVWNNQDMVITFSAGNGGVDTTPSDGIIDTDSIGSPGTAKNCLTVGASENYRPNYQYEYPSGTCNSNPTWNWFNATNFPTAPVSTDLMADNANGMGAFSSRGPCADGRIKPDIVAPGIAIISTRTDLNQAFEQWGTCNIAAAQKTYYLSMGGTSMANPLTAGSAVLVRQYYASGWHPNDSSVTNASANAPDGFNPSAALVKATLINGAWDMTPGQYGTGATKEIAPAWDTGHDLPNNVEGYGRVDLYHSLFPSLGWGANAGRVMEVHDVSPGLVTGSDRLFTFNVGSNANPLVVTLVWTDPYGATAAATELVNNLDLVVKAPGATTTYYVPNRKDQTTTSATDTVNNVEQVVVTTPALGAWTIQVKGTSVPGNGVTGSTTQPYALVISGITCVMAAPASLSATPNGNNRIDLSWSSVGAATEYRVYRATVSGGPYAQIAVVASPATTYADGAVNGGVTYSYVVRAFSASCGESPNSAEASAAAIGPCNLPPSFAGLASVTAPTDATCTLNLSWSAATPQCAGSGSVTYTVYRSTTNGFTPGAGNRIAAGLTSTSYSDSGGLASGTPYYYVVRATDSGDGVEDGNTVQRSGVPVGPLGPVTLFLDTFESGIGLNGWANGCFGTGCSTTDWRGIQACTPTHSGSNIFRFGANACGNDYGNNDNAFVAPGGTAGLAIPADASTVRLSFWHRWSFEAGNDGALMRISQDNANFYYIPAAAAAVWVAGGYNGTVYYPAGQTTTTRDAWTGSANTSFLNTVMDLDAACNYAFGGTAGAAGRTLWIAFGGFSNGANKDLGWFLDDVTITANRPGSCNAPPSPVQAFTARATSGSVKLEWVNPTGAYGSTMIRVRNDGVSPTGPTNGALVCSQAGGGAGAKDACTHAAGVVNGTTYSYSAFVDNGSGVYSGGDTVSARPFDTTGAVKWAYSTGASSLTPPGIWPGAVGTGEVAGVSNDRMLHAMNPTGTGGDWPASWKPLAMNGPAQAWPWMVDIPFGGASREIFVASQDGRVYCVNADTGALVWTSPQIGDVLQDGPSAMFTAYGGAYNLIFACTRNATSGNKVVALDPANGNVLWTFDNGGGANGIGIISSAPWVDYATNRLYFTSRARGGGSSTTVWCISFTGASATKLAGFNPPAIGDADAGATLFQPTGVAAERLYVASNAGVVYALDKTAGTQVWSSTLGDGAIKGYLLPVWGGARIYCTTGTKLWCLTDNGSAAAQTWGVPLPLGATPSMPLQVGTHLLVGGSDGYLYQFDTTVTPPTSAYTRVLLGAAGPGAGSPAYDYVNDMVQVGSEAGIIYGVNRPQL